MPDVTKQLVDVELCIYNKNHIHTHLDIDIGDIE